MDDFTIRRKTPENDVALFELDQHVFGVPVDVPRFHRVVSPRFLMIARVHVHFHDAIVGDAQQFLLFAIAEFDDEQRDSKIGQRLPRFNVVHFGVDQRQIFDVGVRLENAVILEK